jgi:hypothetical protein
LHLLGPFDFVMSRTQDVDDRCAGFATPWETIAMRSTVGLTLAALLAGVAPLFADDC